MQLKQKDIRAYLERGAVNVNTLTADELEQVRPNLERVGLSHGVYGMNGGLWINRENGKWYACPNRSSNLFYLA